MNFEAHLRGIHHITAIAGDPQKNVDFYMGLLGLRLIKRTVNFDDPGSYHLYYGDTVGHPGTIMTFFAWPGARRGRVGTGQVGVTSFSIPTPSLDFWCRRLAAAEVEVTEAPERFGDRVLSFSDDDGMPLELITSEVDHRPCWETGPVPPGNAIRGFHAPTLYLNGLNPSESVLTDAMGFRRADQNGDRVRFVTGEGRPGEAIDLLPFDGVSGVSAVGTVHHIAWRTPDDREELAWQEHLGEHGLAVTDMRDRQYFHSIYYREPGGVLYEIATDEPGFAIDESVAALGTNLMLPPWLESRRAEIESTLPPLRLPPVKPARRP